MTPPPEIAARAADPLGIRAATARVVERARAVRIDDEQVERVADDLRARPLEAPVWRVEPHWWSDEDPAATATYVLLLDALNFSFWGDPKWRVERHGKLYDGYWGLAAALRNAIDDGQPLWDTEYLRTVRADRLLAGAEGTTIPLLEARQAAIDEVAQGVDRACGVTFLTCVQAAGYSATRLVRCVVQELPSFRDVATYDGEPVPLYKRAQILVSDLWGAFQGEGHGRFDDVAALTMFADYKVPQVLHGLGILRYADDLAEALAAHRELSPNHPWEVEIRAASVQAIERLRDALARHGRPLHAFQVDWLLWLLGQGREWPLPYHRTRTTAY